MANLFFETMADALKRGDRVETRGLCSFYVKKYRAYTGRNPKTGKKGQDKNEKAAIFQVRERVEKTCGLRLNL